MKEVEKKYHVDFDRGHKEASVNIRGQGEISSTYKKALDMSEKFGESLEPVDKGYVIGVADRMMSYKGRALDAARLYEKVGAIDNEGVKSELAEGLTKDIAKTHNAKYLQESKAFMKNNNMGDFVKGINIEHAVMNAGRKKMNVLPFVLVAIGIAFSSFKITGNVIGIPDLDNFLGIGFFATGLIWLATSVRKLSPQ
ncbi:MAG: hypothetical protein PF542_03125 [Nanoarchaeota archaeon]|jgi:hypothetical protein|nr:hypothetical protein [Nanoarchaeota archaeon]